MPPERGIGESRAARAVLGLAAVAVIGAVLLLPLAVLFVEAFAEGAGVFWAAVTDADAAASIRLTLLVTAIVVPVNTVFGVAAAWAVTRFRFRGRGILTTLVALPFSVSPVVAGLMYVLLFGRQGWFGPMLSAMDLRIVFALPGIVLATTFVTLPFVAGQLIPLLQSQGVEEEEAALVLGAGAVQMFWHVTLPKARWGLAYGVLLCSARSMGEFGAVSVVSGHIRGVTNTMPLQVEILYNEYNAVAAFSVAALLAGVALVTIGIRSVLEWRQAAGLRRGGRARGNQAGLVTA